MTAPDIDAAASASLASALRGQYEIEREIGRGGMGVVYAARDLKLARRVAIKTLLPHLAGDSSMRERFLREARTAAALSHPGIVPVHRADEIDGQVFFVMGYVDGDSLAHQIRTNGPLSVDDTVRMLVDVASALGYAHEHGVIHRDVKAENILIDRRSGRSTMTDFGIARLAEAAPVTATGQVLGTVYYSSPEQVSGDPIDSRSDIYSLGVVGYLAFSGRFPFDAELASAVLIAHVNKPAPPLSSVSPSTPTAIATVIDQCLRKNPGERFERCEHLVTALERALRESPPVPSVARPKTPIVSDVEAKAIWERAADLQAMTGLRPRPAPISRPRDVSKDVVRKSGYQLGDVRDAALEAGIDEKYVQHAFAEHGLPSTAPAVPSPTVIDRSPSHGNPFGGPVRLEYEIIVDGEMPSDDFDLLADVTRRETGDPGRLSEVGRSFAWDTNPSRYLIHVSVKPRSGKTIIRVSEDLRSWATVMVIGITGAGMLGFAALGPAVSLVGGPLLGLAGTNALFRVFCRRRQRLLRNLGEALAAQVRESIEADR